MEFGANLMAPIVAAAALPPVIAPVQSNPQGASLMKLKRMWNGRPRLRSILAVLVAVAAPAMAHGQQATVRGRVTSTAGEPLVDARVQVISTSVSVSTNSEGRYTLRGAPGVMEIRVLRVGYVEQKKSVTIAPGETGDLDFVMTPAIVKLQEIITTATGETRRVEIGNAISTLGNVTQNVEQTPIVNMADLMVAKAPGVVVLPGAMTGAAPVVHIRGTNSLSLSNNPIYIIDGVRMATDNMSFGFTGTNASLINDIDPNEIEDVEIVKGPSAATLYGTDAANGVIVITTKKGRAGATRWTYYAEGGSVDDRNKYPSTYASWGHDSKGALARCTLVTESQGTCTLDSLTSFNALTDPSTTPIHLGHRNQYGMNASGGSDQVRFFVSGDLQNELGPIHMPAFAQITLDSLGAGARDEWTNPEQFQNQNFRVNMNAAFSPKFDFSTNAGFSSTSQRLPQVDNNTFSFIYSALNAPGFNHPATGTGLTYNEYGSLGEFKNGYGGFSPAQIFQVTNEYNTQRFIGSSDAVWRPFAWMQNEGSAGLDLSNTVRNNLCRFSECPNSGTTRQGFVNSASANVRNFSAKIVSNSSWQARSNLVMKTTVGGDYTNQENDGVSDRSTNLPPGAQNVGQGAVQTVNANTTSLQSVNKTLGLYVQEQASFRDRMFFIVAARTDQNSSFGTNFQRVVYPKASLSWLISDESFFPHPNFLNSFRLRSGYGVSGVQPQGTQALQTFASSTVNIIANSPGAVGGSDTPGLIAAALGNPALKPERSAEWENGFESSVFNNRVHVDVTYYDKRTHDAIVNKPIAASSGASQLTVVTNIASVQNNGIEASLNTTILDRRSIGWDLSVSASHNSNKILGLGVPTIGTGNTRDSLGLPANALFGRPFTYADNNNDGIITPNEVTVSPDVVYDGYATPRDIAAITNGFDLFNRKMRITILTDYKGGYNLFNSSAQFYSNQTKSYPDDNLKSTSLFLQARAVANSSAKNPSTPIGFFDNAATWRLREVSAALTLPNVFAQRIRARDAQIVFSARNLATWTKYTGVDPESNYSTGDVQTDFSTTAPRTYFILRANLHY
jgi:TonB-linked SusC/RagA family outer membrane protein